MSIQTKPCVDGCGKMVPDEGQYGFVCHGCWEKRNQRKAPSRGPAWTRLRKARIASGLSQTELAETAGLTPSWISHFEAGRRLPSLEVFRKICIALDVTADSLLGLKQQERATP